LLIATIRGETTDGPAIADAAKLFRLDPLLYRAIRAHILQPPTRRSVLRYFGDLASQVQWADAP
jgi:hypothetical protein